MNYLAAHAEQQDRIGGPIKLEKKEFCQVIPKRIPDFYMIVKNLEEILDKAEKTEDPDERRKLLPNRLEVNYLKKLVKKLIILRGKLTAKEGKLRRSEMKKEKNNVAYVFVQKGLNPQEQKALAEVVSDLAKKVRKIKAKEKKIRPDFYSEMAATTRIKRQNGGCCR